MKPRKIKKTKVLDIRYILYDLARVLGIIPGYIWLRPKHYYENDAAKKKYYGGAVLMMNHIGFVDPILSQFAIYYRRQHFIAAKEIFEGKAKSVVFTLFKCIKIDRENFNLGSFREITAHLTAGNTVTIYPEGHINFDTESVAAFKSGIVIMALRTGALIIPVYMERNEGFFGKTFFMIGEPIDLKEKYGALPSLETIAKISDDLRIKEEQLGQMLKLARADQKKRGKENEKIQ